MRKGMTILVVLAMVITGFMVVANPVAADGCEQPPDGWFWKSARSACGGFENDAVPVATFVGWIMTIYVENVFDEEMTDIVIKDRLGGELMVCRGCPGMPDPWVSQGSLEITTKGKTEKVFLEWDVGSLQPGESATLMLLMATDLNPGGKQEYTSTGCYMLNSGATLKYYMDGHKDSATTNSIWIKVVEVPE
jgi:hypothetical protein